MTRLTGWVKSHRGIITPYLSVLKGIQLYVLEAVMHEASPTTALCELSQREIASIVDADAARVGPALRRLHALGLITYEAGRNQYARTMIDVSPALGLVPIVRREEPPSRAVAEIATACCCGNRNSKPRKSQQQTTEIATANHGNRNSNRNSTHGLTCENEPLRTEELNENIDNAAEPSGDPPSGPSGPASRDKHTPVWDTPERRRLMELLEGGR